MQKVNGTHKIYYYYSYEIAGSSHQTKQLPPDARLVQNSKEMPANIDVMPSMALYRVYMLHFLIEFLKC